MRVRRRALLAVLGRGGVPRQPGAGRRLQLSEARQPDHPGARDDRGIHVGERLGAARKAWGSGRGSCQFRDSGITVCTYGNERDEGRGVAYFAAQGSSPSSRIYLVTIAVGLRLGVVPVYKGPLMRIRTRHGIGLGSRARRLRRAYPRLRRNSTGFYLRRRKVVMQFDTFNSTDRHTVTTIDASLASATSDSARAARRRPSQGASGSEAEGFNNR